MIKLQELLKEEWNPIIYEITNLFESPLRIGKWDANNLSNNTHNVAFTQKIKEISTNTDKYKKYDIYSYNIKNMTYTIFTKGDFTVAYFSYQIKNNNWIERQVWQEFTASGLCREILFEYFLPKFKSIESDGTHSDLGEKYWKKLVDEAIHKGFSAYAIFDKDEKSPIKLKSSSDMDQYYGSANTSLNTRFLITKNK